MTTNKIPTDEEILEEWAFDDFDLIEETTEVKVTGKQLLWLIGKARLAGVQEGRREQMESDIKKIKMADVELGHSSSGGFTIGFLVDDIIRDATFSWEPSEAICHQAEGTKEGEEE